MLIKTGFYLDGTIYYLSTAEKKGLYRIQDGVRGGGLFLAFVGTFTECESYIKAKNETIRNRS